MVVLEDHNSLQEEMEDLVVVLLYKMEAYLLVMVHLVKVMMVEQTMVEQTMVEVEEVERDRLDQVGHEAGDDGVF